LAIHTLSPQPWLIFLDDNGRTIPNGQLAIYLAGTSTPVAAYADSSGVAHPFPITLDCAGRVPGGLYLDPGLNYKFVLHQPKVEAPLDGAIIKTQDNISPTPGTASTRLQIFIPGDYANLNVQGVSSIEYHGNGDLFIRGMTGGVVGQSILIRNLTAGRIWLYNDDPAAAFGDRIGNFIRLGPMPMAGVRSTARYVYVASGWWAMEIFEMGEPIVPNFDPAVYGGLGGMTWTVEPSDVIYENFYISGRELTYSFFFQATSVGGTPDTYLLRTLPVGWTLLSSTPAGVSNTVSGILVQDNGSPYTLGVAAMYDHTRVRFERDPHLVPWSLSNNLTALVGRLQLILD